MTGPPLRHDGRSCLRRTEQSVTCPAEFRMRARPGAHWLSPRQHGLPPPRRRHGCTANRAAGGQSMRTEQLLLRSGLTVAAVAALPLALTAGPAAAASGISVS